jgi:integrase
VALSHASVAFSRIIWKPEIEMSVRKRTWTNSDGTQGESWVVNYTDRAGTRRLKSFEKKRDAIAYHAQVGVDVRAGIHTADSLSVTVAEAGKLRIETATNAGFERSTLAQYKQHLDYHIIPLIGATKLSQLTVPMVRDFEDRLAADRSPAMVHKVIVSLGAIIADAQERGLVAQNVVRGLRRSRRGAPSSKRRRRRLEVGVDIPTPEEIGRISAHLMGFRRPLLLTAIFTGLRASELRGLRWADIDLKAGRVRVRQRVDRYQRIGALKTEAGARTVPLPPLLLNVLREWKLACPKSSRDLAFANRAGNPMALADIVRRSFQPAQVAAGVVNAKGKAKYGGLHTLRHFYASWCINRKADGGLELPLKLVSTRLGHATIAMTADRYGHLFPSNDDGAELAAAERALVAR